MKDMISIIIPYYNSIKTIEKCVESVLAQTYKNFEAIFVNDGGNDASYDVLLEYSKADSRIVLINKEHSGVSATRNKGLEVAKGDYIQFLDSDDTIEPTMFEKMIKAMKENDADLVICNYTHPSIKNYLGDCILDIENKADLLKYCQITFAMVVPWNKLYKRQAIVEKYDESVHFCEDDLFALNNLKNIKKVVSLKDELYHYYVPPKEASASESGCINAMAKDKAFWLNKNTFWYMRRVLLERSLDNLKEHLDFETAEDCAYARMFDFMIWELLIMDQCGASREGLICEMQNIFKEPEFLKSIKLREKYGLKMREFEPSQYDERVKEFVIECFKISDMSQADESFRGFYACLYLFINKFMEPCGEIDDTDIIARGYAAFINSSDQEANYVKEML